MLLEQLSLVFSFVGDLLAGDSRPLALAGVPADTGPQGLIVACGSLAPDLAPGSFLMLCRPRFRPLGDAAASCGQRLILRS